MSWLTVLCVVIGLRSHLHSATGRSLAVCLSRLLCPGRLPCNFRLLPRGPGPTGSRFGAGQYEGGAVNFDPLIADFKALGQEAAGFYVDALAVSTAKQYDAHMRYLIRFCVSFGVTEELQCPSESLLIRFVAFCARTASVVD